MKLLNLMGRLKKVAVMDIRTDIDSPTLMIDQKKVLQNIQFMADKALQQGVRLRPHFKTHQSAVVGAWFRPFGVNAITVSSVDMAKYFADHGWDDILIAFSLNLRQVSAIQDLARTVRLGVLVEHLDAVEALSKTIENPLDVWIKIDTGTGRTGLIWQDTARIYDLAQNITASPKLQLRGLLTHAGFTYSASSADEVVKRYKVSCLRMNELRAELSTAGLTGLEVSVGDTPGCTLSPDPGKVDEIRPGNFVFYDAQMVRLGVCQAEQVAGVVACPVVAMHPQRNEVVIYGGAVHLSKDTVEIDGRQTYGAVVELNAHGWDDHLAGAFVSRLSQEHGILQLPSNALERLKVGDLLGVMPAHVCLVVSALGIYRTLDGEQIQAFPRA
jgi:D-serine deaminase-like pyridoxal phosphate-dependent protein